MYERRNQRLRFMKPADEREEELFEAALERREGPEREAFLDQACAGDEGLRARLKALLQAHESTEEFLGPKGGDLRGQAIPLPGPDLTVERTGTMIGRYKLLEKIDEGGFGVVYVAEQREPVKRRV